MAISEIKWKKYQNQYHLETRSRYNYDVLAAIIPGKTSSGKIRYDILVLIPNGTYKYLKYDCYSLVKAKNIAERYMGVKVTSSKKKKEYDYGIKGDWRPFEGM